MASRSLALLALVLVGVSMLLFLFLEGDDTQPLPIHRSDPQPAPAVVHRLDVPTADDGDAGPGRCSPTALWSHAPTPREPRTSRLPTCRQPSRSIVRDGASGLSSLCAAGSRAGSGLGSRATSCGWCGTEDAPTHDPQLARRGAGRSARGAAGEPAGAGIARPALTAPRSARPGGFPTPHARVDGSARRPVRAAGAARTTP